MIKQLQEGFDVYSRPALPKTTRSREEAAGPAKIINSRRKEQGARIFYLHLKYSFCFHGARLCLSGRGRGEERDSRLSAGRISKRGERLRERVAKVSQ